jgi:hypothetical protein
MTGKMTGGPMPDRLSRGALAWFTLTTVVFWLPTVRGLFDGPSYQWGLFGFGGRGVSGDYWFPLAGAAAALLTLAGGWRGQSWAFAVATVWSLLMLVAVVAASASNPDDFRFRGETLGVDVSLAWVGPVMFAGGSVLSVAAARRVHRRAKGASGGWPSPNTRWLVVLTAALPLQFFLLRFGSGESPFDQVGAVLTIGQWLMVGRLFRPMAGTAE